MVLTHNQSGVCLSRPAGGGRDRTPGRGGEGRDRWGPAEHILVDPGIGFGKQAEHNLEILRHLDAVKSALGYPVLLGTSRKSFIGLVLGDVPPHNRVEGTAATVAVAIMQGVDMVRVHDVKQMVRVARMTDAIVRGWRRPLS
jgi:dihydropteroate synthase